MIDKIVPTSKPPSRASSDGATVLIGGFGTRRHPAALIDALIAQGARDLTIVNNNAGNGDTGPCGTARSRRVRKIVCSFPRQIDSYVFDGLYRAGEIELELVPQGTLAERIRAAGAGIGGFLHADRRTGPSSPRARRRAIIDGRGYVLEHPLRADFALSKPSAATAGATSSTGRPRATSGPIMATAAKCTIAQVREIVALGALDPEAVVDAGIFVKRVVRAGTRRERALRQAA